MIVLKGGVRSSDNVAAELCGCSCFGGDNFEVKYLAFDQMGCACACPWWSSADEAMGTSIQP
jgi:hypothetical protein